MESIYQTLTTPPLSYAMIWLIVAIVFASLELTLSTFGFILVGLSAVIAAVFAAAGLGLIFQLGAFSVSIILSLGLLRPRLINKLHGPEKMLSRTEKLVGHVAEVTEDIDPSRGGRVTVQGEDWAACCSKSLTKGTKVKVTEADGIVLRVDVI